jgi:ribonuclease P protein component
VLFAISKKRVPRAVARNRIRRRIREAYRLNKQPLFQSLHNQKIKVSLIITYIGDETTTWKVMEKKIVLLLQDIVNRVLVS